TWLAVTVLMGITLAFYHRLWFPGLALVKRDALRFFLPIKQYLVERLWAGELPQWFPYEALGRPFIGATHTGVFHPSTALYFLFPVPDAYRASILTSCLLAALGAFVLGRLLRLSPAGALLAGIAFALSGYVVSLTENIQYLYSICMLPLFCAALERALSGDRAWIVAPAIVWTTVFLNGDVQTGYYYGFIALAWAAARAPGLYRDAGLRLALTVALTILLSGIQLGPSWTVFMWSERTHPELFLEQALFWSTHPLRLVTVLASPVGEHVDPVIVASKFFNNAIPGFLADSLYIGVPVAGLALLGAWGRRDLRVLVLLGSLALLLALGPYGGLYEIFYTVVPLWSAFRYPEKLMGVVSFTAAMLAGAGLDALWARKGSSAPWLAMAILCATAGFALRTEAVAVWTAAHFGAAPGLAHEVTRSAALAFLYSAAATLSAWLITAGVQKQVLREVIALPLLVLLVTLDLARANLGAYHTGPAEVATFMPPLAEALRAQEEDIGPGHFRMVSIFERTLVMPQEIMQTLGFYGSASVERRQALDVEHNATFHLESAMPYLAGYSTQFAETMNSRMGFAAAARLNVSYYIGRRYHLKEPRLARTLVAELPPYDLVLFRNPISAKPRAYLSQQPERATTPVDPMALFTRPDYQRGEVDVIESPSLTLPGPSTGGLATIERYAPETVQVRVETPQPAVLILLDAFDQGWAATLESGLELPILRANALVRAVVVPAGTHLVTFSYQTPLLKAGAAASLVGCLLCTGLITHAWWRHRHPAGPCR
ncbi:MAG TPA: YfhO family protein, partial [Terriglobales bacterium]|nr:YfhO family protein [Terriglobales bacterium]